MPTAIKIRLLVLDTPTPHIHSSWDASEVGPFSLGFPNTKHLEIDAKLRKLGFGATSGEASQYEIQNPDGGSYLVQETIFLGPDFVELWVYIEGEVNLNCLPLTLQQATVGQDILHRY